MAIRVNPKIIDDLEGYGAEDVQLCYHCGNCSAVCPHADEFNVFPRRPMRNLQLGLERKLETSLEPWLCYYCGQCSDQCPRGAEPGETMMSLRRWLISRYDFTGIARLFFKSTKVELAAVIIVALLTGIFFLGFGFWQGDINVYDGSNAFLPSSFIHNFDLALGFLVALFIGSSAFRFWWFSMGRKSAVPIPWWLYIKKVYLLPWHFFTQKRYADCEKDEPRRIYMPWLAHLGLMLGYVAMLFIVMVFVKQLQAGPEINWSVHVFGYLASLGLLIGAAYMLRGRLKKNRTQYQRSHGSDWIFLILLFIIASTGVTQHILHRSGLLFAANIVYIVHLMVVVPWLLRMPFTKWAHMFLRPLGMYFSAVRNEALVRQQSRIESTVLARKVA
ncbi:MAG: 4Fe-4S dicluster domain-containing protein [Chrysiogenia bacterium]